VLLSILSLQNDIARNYNDKQATPLYVYRIR
jgi:hypothetical protein